MTVADGKQGQRMTTGSVQHHGLSAHNTEWLTAKEAAAYLKVQHRTVCKWATQGKIPGHSLSVSARRTWRFLRSELDSMLRSS